MVDRNSEDEQEEWTEDQLKERFYKNLEDGLVKLGVNLIPEEEITKQKPEIGKGAFGKVFKGVYKDNKIAIKKILPKDDIFEEREATDDATKEILNEIESVLHVQIEGTPKFFGICKKKGVYNLIFELIEGETLTKKYPFLTTKEKLDIVYQLANILSVIHSKRLIHRDIKPSNLMIIPGPKVKLIDFGVSRIAQKTQTYTEAQAGTTRYMAPEYYDIDPDLDRPIKISPKTDIWSTGCLISEIFTGSLPWKGIDEMKLRKLLASGKEFPIPRAEIEKIEIADKVTIIDLIEKCVDPNPEKRVSASELALLINEKLEKLK